MPRRKVPDGAFIIAKSGISSPSIDRLSDALRSKFWIGAPPKPLRGKAFQASSLESLYR